ncbi:matrixin family metalloprotease [Microvirga sp. STR05]|uniref:Matrixin family metalloprotease n=1 Tax=Hymenobacter duratus TaxID=2771356 RepID=A0ABR8JGP2_9BACT|nr:matrixin family metalloprotease [Hymenobacter duratus]MBD2713724.1 matrixin family metalloprotease [Hymenobacter duratus]MBR7948626.1 matrixin family metalloprotease [Microvirga sp. STR05]
MKLLVCLLLLASWLGFPLSSSAQTMTGTVVETHCLLSPIGLDERAGKAALVVEAEVLDARSFWDTGHRRIYTAHTIRVFSSFKGNAPQELSVLTEGGTVGLDRQELTNTLHLQPGDQGVLFLEPSALPGASGSGWAVYGSSQGFIRYKLSTGTATDPFQEYGRIDAGLYPRLTAATGQLQHEVQPNKRLQKFRAQYVQPLAARGQAPVISGMSPAILPAGTGAVLTVSGSGFGATRGGGFVEFRNADNGGSSLVKPQESEYVSWTDTRIQVRVPALGQPASPAGSGPVRVTTNDQQQASSMAAITVPYAVSAVLATQTNELVQPAHVNRNGRGGYSFRFETGFANNAAAVAGWRRALAIWRCQTRINWEADQQVRTNRGAAEDGENSVGFDQGAELPVGILGRTTSYYRGCFKPNGQLAFTLHEIDMQFDDAATWQFGPAPATGLQFDFESVVVHELGHAHQLAHVILPGAVMHYAMARAQTNRLIGPNDVSGGRLVLRTRGFVPQGCGPAPMLPAPLTSFTAAAAMGGVLVSWATTAECVAESFQVQRGRDTTSWQVVATVNSPGPYQHLDAQPLPGLAYYRLRLVQPDGTVVFTAPILTASTDILAVGPSLYPNPVAEGTLWLQYPAVAEGRANFSVYDAVGRLASSNFLDFQPGLNALSIPAAGLNPGWYLLRYRDSEGRTGALPFLKTRE